MSFLRYDVSEGQLCNQAAEHWHNRLTFHSTEHDSPLIMTILGTLRLIDSYPLQMEFLLLDNQSF